MHRVTRKTLLFLSIFAAGYILHGILLPGFVIPENPKGKNLIEKRKPQKPSGFWFKNKGSNPPEEDLEKLAALGYVDGSRKPNPKTGVVLHKPSLIQPGINYYTSGHGPEAILIDNSGQTLHKWRMRFDRAFPDAKPERRKALGTRYFRAVHLFENGDLLAIYEGVGLVKLDKDSKILWTFAGSAHHDLHVQPDGKIYALTRTARLAESFNHGQPVLEDFVSILEPSGKEIRKISILKALLSSIYAPALQSNSDFPNGDLFHTNTVEVLDGSLEQKAPFLKKGNILLSLCFLDMVAVLDPQQEKIVWALSHLWSKQHTPVFLQEGNLLVFDNGNARKKSRVIQIHPLTHQVHWLYDRGDFYSEILGYAQRLPNGNTLITDSDDGRAFEVTTEKQIVWEFLSPHRAGSNSALVAVLPEMRRLPLDFPMDWLRP